MVFGLGQGWNMKYCYKCMAILEADKNDVCSRCKEEIKPPEDKNESEVSAQD